MTMKPEWDRLQAPSPRESMHSELLMHRNRHEIPVDMMAIEQTYDFAAWLKLRNTHDLPVLLLLEHTDFRGDVWHIIDSARIRNIKGSVLLSGQVAIKERRIQEMKLYICHPSPDLKVEVEELRFNGELIRKDFVDATNVA